MRASTLFTFYAGLLAFLIVASTAAALYGIERHRQWEARTELAHESYQLHLELEAAVFRLFKQHGDALLIGDRDGGVGEEALMTRISDLIAAIRNVIGREIRMVGDEEIAELGLLAEIEEELRDITTALSAITVSGGAINRDVQLSRLTDLLDRRIDVLLTRNIEAAIEGERAEVAEVLAHASAFRAANRRVVFALVIVSLAVLVTALWSFHRQIRAPLLQIGNRLADLKRGVYPVAGPVGGSREVAELCAVLDDMSSSLKARDVIYAERQRELETQVSERAKELQRIAERVESGEANRRQLLADISHELRTPLAIILGEAEVALRTGADLPDDLSDSLGRIRDAARHTNQIVDDLLTIARREAGQLRLHLHETDLRKILRDAVEMFPGHIDLAYPSDPVYASVDETRLRQCILAVFQNARRYGGPRISARLETGPEAHVFTVEDDGPGMTDQEKAHAFERFFRGNNASRGSEDGSGLGLPIVKAIVEAHGGSASIKDVETGGVRIILELPQKPRIQAVEGTRSTAWKIFDQQIGITRGSKRYPI
ncbi:signal transduction histidine kinase [Celeribacter persicus]|uniref:histidine kinase n=2 Tax=Celeribacter persicus TaxID=1651082 RepID=A0A2T5HSM6_9RHOB|nr:signal transduction histidine kinase [Celeribacter persicus]